LAFLVVLLVVFLVIEANMPVPTTFTAYSDSSPGWRVVAGWLTLPQ